MPEREEEETGESSEEEDSEDDEEEGADTDDDLAHKMSRGAGISTPGSDEADRTRILSVLELEDLFLSQAPKGMPQIIIAYRRLLFAYDFV